jgi:hypothetical protein
MGVGIGEMRQIGTLWQNYPARVGAGRRDEFYYLGDPNTGGPLVVRGRLKVLSAGRSLTAGDITLNSTHEWVCHYGSIIVGALNKDAKWVIEDRTFIIDSYELMDQKKRMYVFKLKEER